MAAASGRDPGVRGREVTYRCGRDFLWWRAPARWDFLSGQEEAGLPVWGLERQSFLFWGPGEAGLPVWAGSSAQDFLRRPGKRRDFLFDPRATSRDFRCDTAGGGASSSGRGGAWQHFLSDLW